MSDIKIPLTLAIRWSETTKKAVQAACKSADALDDLVALCKAKDKEILFYRVLTVSLIATIVGFVGWKFVLLGG